MLVTGHTGFKGAWLSLWLQSLGADVIGLSPAARRASPSLYELARRRRAHARAHRRRARRRTPCARRCARRDPEVVLHLAAQPMVRRSLRDPALTYEVNVHRHRQRARRRPPAPATTCAAVVVVTSDKCYENPAGAQRLVRRGATRSAAPTRTRARRPAPSSSTAAYRQLVLLTQTARARLATARAGNVIGGGDWGEDRLLADAVRAVERGEPLRVRNPHAVRPWQHVLNPLSGYLLPRRRRWPQRPRARRARMELRPAAAATRRTSAGSCERLGALWDGELQAQLDEAEHPPEAGYLSLDSAAAEQQLGWRARWDLEQALASDRRLAHGPARR